MTKKLKWNLILMSLLYLALGIFLLMVPGTALNVVCYALGGVVLACAAVFHPAAEQYADRFETYNECSVKMPE